MYNRSADKQTRPSKISNMPHPPNLADVLKVWKEREDANPWMTEAYAAAEARNLDGIRKVLHGRLWY